MIREGNTVAPFFNMGRRAIVVEIREVKSSTWMVGGSAGHARVAKIKFVDNDEIAEYPTSDLMKVD